MSIFFILLLNFAVAILIYIFLRIFIVKYLNNHGFLRETQQKLETIIAEMNGATERNVNLIEDKIKTAKALLESAEQTITRINQAVTDARLQLSQLNHAMTDPRLQLSQSPSPTQMATSQTDAPTQPTGVNQLGASTFYKKATENNEEAEQQIDNIATAHSHSPPPIETISQRIIALHREGLANTLIAKRLGIAISEVEMVTSLI